MTRTAGLTAILVIAAVAGSMMPDRALFQTGWYATIVAAVAATTMGVARGEYRRGDAKTRTGVVLAAFSAAILGLAIVSNALFAPDPRTIVAAPGQRAPVPELAGDLEFPMQPDGTVRLVRGSRNVVEIGTSPRYTGSFVLRSISRDVVVVSAANARGQRLTITQPSGAAFLSPVLLMERSQTVAGMTVPVDSFAVPAARRVVHAVLFDPEQAARLRAPTGPPGFAVLFDVDDDQQQPLSNAIRIVRDGGTTGDVAGLRLRADVVAFPSVRVVAAPSLAATLLGIVLAICGLSVPMLQPLARTSEA